MLIDPDKMSDKHRLSELLGIIRHSHVDFILIGGSLLTEDHFEDCVKFVKAESNLPVVLFPGSPAQISNHADSILLLSLISGRNADLLIGQQVVAAPRLKKSSLEIIPTGYMLVDCGRSTTASYISQTFPMPWNKPEIAVATGMAGEMLGMKCLYLDGGSGADKPVSGEMIRAVREETSVPLIVGGGIRNEDEAFHAWNSGADLVVIGTAFENEPELLFSIVSQRLFKS